MPLHKDFFHKHTYDDIKYRNIPLNFKIRFEEAFGYFQKGVYTQTKKGKIRDYRTPWILLEDTPENRKRFAWVFYNFNIFTTLNYYREKQVTKECFVDLAFDFDAPELENAWEDALKMTEFLQSKHVPHSLFFSGKKGFHIVVGYEVFGQEYQENNHLVNKEIINLIMGKTGHLYSLDMSIYSSRRQFRLENSKHSGSGLFKIPLTFEELAAGPDAILKLAGKPRDNFPAATDAQEIHPYLSHLYIQAKQNKDRLPQYDVPEIDLGVLGKKLPPCIQECLDVGIKPEANANRNETTMLLATFFKCLGQDIQITRDLLINHALSKLKSFSSSTDREIISSTKTCITTIYRNPDYKFNCHFARGKFRLRCDDTCKLYGKYRDNRYSRKLEYIEVEPPPPPPTYTVEEIRSEIPIQIDNYLDDYQNKILLIKVPAGVGKTLTTIKHLSFGKHRIFWVAGRKDMFGNIPFDHQFKWKQILGRHSGSYDKFGQELVPPNCIHADLAHILGAKNHDISQRLCKEHCDVGIMNCDYFRQFHDRERHWFVQQPFFFYTKDNFVDPFDLVVIDEDVLEGFKKETKITLDDLRQNCQLLKNAKDDRRFEKLWFQDLFEFLGKPPKAIVNINPNMDPAIKLLYITGLVAKSEIPFGFIETGKLILEKIEEIAMEKLREDIRDILRSITDPDVFDKEVRFELENGSKIPLNFFRYLYEVLYFEFFDKHPENNLSRIFFQKHRAKDGQGSVCLENFLLISKLEKHTDKPIIILDATGKKRIYEKLFDREVIEYAPQIKLENEIIQVYSSSNSKRSLSNPRHFQRNMEAVKNLVADVPNTLIISKEIFTNRIADQVPTTVKVAHFYGIRGSNEYQDFDQVIIFGTPQIREEDIKKFASMMHFNEPRAVDTSVEWQYRPYMALAQNSRAPAVKVRMFKDQLLQDILEISREDEINQAINRIRIVHDFTKRVVILSNIPLPGLPITELVELRDLTGDLLARTAIMRACRYFLDKFGFVQRTNFIDWNLNTEYEFTPELETCFSEYEILLPASKRYARRTINIHFRPIVEQFGLNSFQLKFKDRNEHGFLEVWGHDEGCLERARLLFSKIRKDMMFY